MRIINVILLSFFILITVVIITLFNIVVFHRFYYPFWKTQPVPWTSLWKSKKGLIHPPPLTSIYEQTEHWELPLFHEIVPVTTTTAASSTSSTTMASSLQSWISVYYYKELLKPPFTLIHHPKNRVDDPLYRLRTWLILREEQKRTAIRGSISGYSAKYRIDHTSYQVLHIHHLILHPHYRKQHLAPRLILEMMKQHPECPIGLFQTHSRLPFPYLSHVTYYWAHVHSILLPSSSSSSSSSSDHSSSSSLWRRYDETIQDSFFLPMKVKNNQDLMYDWRSNRSYWTSLLSSKHHQVWFHDRDEWVHVQVLPLQYRKTNYPVYKLISGNIVSASSLFSLLRQVVSAEEVIVILPCFMKTWMQEKGMVEDWELFEEYFIYFYNYRFQRYCTPEESFQTFDFPF